MYLIEFRHDIQRTFISSRTQPRMFTRYGAPVPVPRQSANPQSADADEVCSLIKI